MLVLICTLAVSFQKAPVVIPVIGRVLGQPIGYATREDFIQKLGPPTRSMGGHPNGTSSWFDPVNRLTISMDGFDYARNGMLVDWIEIRPAVDTPKIKRVQPKLKASDYRLCGGAFAFGMSYARSQEIARTKGWKYREGENALVLTSPGNVDFRGACSNEYRVSFQWETTLEFTRGQLSGITLTVDYKTGP